MGCFIEVEVDEFCLVLKLFKSDFVACIFADHFLFSLGIFEVAVSFDEGDVVEVFGLAEMSLSEEFNRIFSIVAKKDVGLPTAAEVGVGAGKGCIDLVGLF